MRYALALLLCGCTGLIDSPAGSGGGGGGSGPSGTPDDDPGSVRGEPVPSTSTRRLSAHELANSVEALTGLSPDALSMLPPESTDLAFDRVVNAQTVSPAHLDAYLAIGAEVAARLIGEQRLDEITEACPDAIVPPATPSTETRVSGAGLGGGPDWAFAVDTADPTKTRVRYAPDPIVSYTHTFGAAGRYTVALSADVTDGEVDTTEVWVGGTRADAIPSTSGPTVYTSTVDVAAAGPAVIEYRFVTEPDDNNLTIEFDELSITGPVDPGAVTDAGARRGCAEALIDALAPRAFRRPITAEERARFVSLLDAGSDFVTGVTMAVQAILASPSFLYLVEVGTPVDGRPGWFRLDPWETAARLSYALCESPPDEALRAAAAAGELDTADAREAEARRLLGSECGHAAVRRFVSEWLRLDRLPGLNKSPEAFPAFTDAVRDALAVDAMRYVDEMLWTERVDLRGLYGEPIAWPSAETASLYGLSGGTGARVDLPAERAGILTHPGFLAVTAPFAETSPVARGVFVVEQVLCEELSPPPAELAVTPPPPDPSLTTRERWDAHSSDPVCAGCHSQIDPVGFAFEEFDGIGQHRTMENGRAVDARGGAPVIGIADGELNGAAELSRAIAESSRARECFAKQWLRFSLGRMEVPADEEALAATATALDDEPIVEALVSLVRSDVFAHRFEEEEEE